MKMLGYVKKIDLSNVEIAKAVVSIFIIFISVMTCAKQIFYVETGYIQDAMTLRSGGVNLFLSEYQSRLGPLYPIIQFLISPVTDFNIPAVRILNDFFLLGSLAAYFFACNAVIGVKDSIVKIAGILSVPGIWVASSIASGDVAPIFFMSWALFFFKKFKEEPLRRRFFWIVGLLFWQLSIFSCQFYFFITPFLGLLVIKNKCSKNFYYYLSIILIMLIPCWLYVYWGGIYSPEKRELMNASSNYMSFKLIVTSGAYAYLCSYLLDPRSIKITKKGICFFAGCLVVNFLIVQYKILPLRSVLESLISNKWLAESLALILGTFFLFLAVHFFFIFTVNIFKNRGSAWSTFLGFSSVLMVVMLGYGAVSFSFRYVLPALPFLFFLNDGKRKLSLSTVLIGILGSGIGVLAMRSYLN